MLTDEELFYHEKCDNYDKGFAIFAGSVGGIIDSLFVGNGIDSKLGKWSDATTEKFVMAFAKRFAGWDGKGDVRVALQRFENSDFYKKHKVNYEERQSKDVNNQFSMSPTNHRIKSLAHSPDLTGLIFSIIDQYTGTSHFVSDGQIYVVQSKTSDLTLYGNSFPAKIFCGFVNWFIHLVSDVSGSASSQGRGAGIPLPFFNLLLLCDFGSIKVGNNKWKTISEFSTIMFENGYEFRVGIAQSIPVIVTNVLVDVYWAFKQFFYRKRPMKECIPNALHDDLRMMQLIANSSFCVIDLTDAAIRSAGDSMIFFMHINYIGWMKLTKLVFREICIRFRLGKVYFDAQMLIIDQQLDEYLGTLNRIDYETAEKEVAQIKQINDTLNSLESNKDCVNYLYSMIEERNIDIQFHNHSEFEDFMHSNKRLIL